MRSSRLPVDRIAACQAKLLLAVRTCPNDNGTKLGNIGTELRLEKIKIGYKKWNKGGSKR
jgi:hypothetical protein